MFVFVYLIHAFSFRFVMVAYKEYTMWDSSPFPQSTSYGISFSCSQQAMMDGEMVIYLSNI